MFGQGRLHLVRSQPAAAIEYYERALEAQNQYRNLHHISFWEIAIANLALWDVPAALEHWRTLAAEATVRRLSQTLQPLLLACCVLRFGCVVRRPPSLSTLAFSLSTSLRDGLSENMGVVVRSADA